MDIDAAIKFFRIAEPFLRMLAMRTDTPLDDKALNFLSDLIEALAASPAMQAMLEKYAENPPSITEAELAEIATLASHG